MGEQVLYHSKEYTVFHDKVIQGEFEGIAQGPRSIVSNYQSQADHHHSRGISFKFSLNGGDNELPVHMHHYVVLYPEKGLAESPVIRFGKVHEDPDAPENDFLEPDTFFRIQLDMRPVLQDFEEKGYYENFEGERISKEDFSGLYVAGDTPPLSWDFENLPEQEGVQLRDEDGDGIYEVLIHLNKSKPQKAEKRKWELKEDISEYPEYHSPHLLVNALYNLSLEELKLDIRPDETFMAGEEWYGVWTRDISYSILLSLAAIEPRISKKSLLKKVSNNRIVQDTGTGGSWPVSTDRVTWAFAAWEVYKVSGEQEWLKQAFEIIKNTVEDDLKVAFDADTGLFYGESSFLDWREQSYPAWMDSADIYRSQCLGTNAVHYQTYHILGLMGDILGEDVEHYRQIAKKVRDGINRYLWVAERGYYGQFLYGRHYGSLSPRAEGLGEALTVLFNIADRDRQEEVVRSSPNVPFGCPSIYPQIPGIPPYHNNGIWPFVQAYWNWAAAKVGNEQALLQGLGALYRQAALFLSNKENLVAQTGDFHGTAVNSNRQLWSVAGNLAMVYRIFFGMQFDTDGIQFSPFVPEAYAGHLQLKDFRYRKAELDLSIQGWGRKVKEMYLDGERLQEARIPADLTGEHSVKILLKEQKVPEKEFNLSPNLFSLGDPELEWKDGNLQWEPIKGAEKYRVLCNGTQLAEIKETKYTPDKSLLYAEFQVSAVDAKGHPSFLSQPLLFTENTKVYHVQMENLVKKYSSFHKGFNGKGYVKISKEKNVELPLSLEVDESGIYLLDFRFSNGNGPIHSDNKAAIRSLLKEEEYIGAVVFPQRGEGEWSNWGWSNSVKLELEKGKNHLRLALRSCSENMNREENSALLDQLRLIRIG